MDNQDNAAEGQSNHLIRFTPKSAPFRRGGLAFPNLDQVTLSREHAEEVLSEAQMRQIVCEPMLEVDVSDDGGKTWARFEAPPEPEETGSRRKR